MQKALKPTLAEGALTPQIIKFIIPYFGECVKEK